jgi:hypothetical protein
MVERSKRAPPGQYVVVRFRDRSPAPLPASAMRGRRRCLRALNPALGHCLVSLSVAGGRVIGVVCSVSSELPVPFV